MSRIEAALTLGRFHCQELLEASGATETYRARVYGLAGLDRPFAIKRLRPGGEDPAMTARFLDAGRLALPLSDARVARVLEVNVDGESTYVATEFVHGIDLRQLGEASRMAPGGRVEPAFVAFVGAQAALALAAAHEAAEPMIHGGLTPGNIMVTTRGDVKVLDFGIAAAVRLATDAELRSWSYAAPEVVAGDRCDERGDLYALGAVLYELGAGRPPFIARTLDGLRQQMADGAPPLPGVPEPLASVIVSLLAASAAGRPQSATAVAALFAEASIGLQPGDPKPGLVKLVRQARKPVTGVESPAEEPAPSNPPAAEAEPQAELERSTGAEYESRELVMEIVPDEQPAGRPPRVPIEALFEQSNPAIAHSQAAIPLTREAPQKSGGPGPGWGELDALDQAEAAPAPSPGEVLAPADAEVSEPSGARHDAAADAGARPPISRAVIIGAAVIAVLGAVGLGLKRMQPRPEPAGEAAPVVVAAPVRTQAPSTVEAPAPAPPAVVAPVPSPAASAVPSPAATAVAAPPPPVAAPPAGEPKPGHLHVTTTPAGAAVWIDGTERGVAPVDVDVGAGRHRVALVLAGTKLTRKTVDATAGARVVETLEAVTPGSGAAGIKVRCKTEGKLPVFVDGKDTGLICPTERIGVEPGEHEISVYVPADDKFHGQTDEFVEDSISTRVRFRY